MKKKSNRLQRRSKKSRKRSLNRTSNDGGYKIESSLNFIVNKLNEEYDIFYKWWYPDDINDFTKCCTDEEKEILLKCFKIYRKYDSHTDYFTILLALIIFYYSIQVLEYYAPNNDVFDVFLNKIMTNYKFISSKDIIKIKKIVNKLTISNDNYAKKIRRTLLNLDLSLSNSSSSSSKYFTPKSR